MKCAEAERLLYLHRPGERNEMEEHLLGHHLERCASCRALAGRVAELEAATGRIRGAEPRMEHPEELTRSVMQAVTALRSGERGGRVLFLDAIIEWSSRRAVRFACVSVVTLALLSSSYESISLATRVRALEEHVSSSQEGPDLLRVAWSVPLGPLKSALGNGQAWAEVSRFIPGAGAASVTVTRGLLEAAMEAMGSASDIDRATAQKVLRAAQEHGQRKIQFTREGA